MSIEISVDIFDLLLSLLVLNLAGFGLLLWKGRKKKMSVAMDNFNVAMSSLDGAANSVVAVATDYMAKAEAMIVAGASANDPAIQIAADKVNAIATVLLQQAAKMKG